MPGFFSSYVEQIRLELYRIDLVGLSFFAAVFDLRALSLHAFVAISCRRRHGLSSSDMLQRLERDSPARDCQISSSKFTLDDCCATLTSSTMAAR